MIEQIFADALLYYAYSYLSEMCCLLERSLKHGDALDRASICRVLGKYHAEMVAIERLMQRKDLSSLEFSNNMQNEVK